MTNIDKTMNENEQENLDSTNETETTENQEVVGVVEETTEETTEPTEDVETLKKQIATLTAQKEHWKGKATKVVEVEESKPAPRPVVSKKEDISPLDTIALIKADVVEAEDIQEVVDFAKFKKISVAEALKSPIVKATLGERKEQRTTAQATNTSASRRGSAKVSDDTLVSKATKGELPESEEDLVRLIRARKGLK